MTSNEELIEQAAEDDRMMAGELLEGVLFFGACILIALLFLVGA